ncbi:hypothetical protein ACTFIU_001178 [Dictyostelium citrinum]
MVGTLVKQYRSEYPFQKRQQQQQQQYLQQQQLQPPPPPPPQQQQHQHQQQTIDHFDYPTLVLPQRKIVIPTPVVQTLASMITNNETFPHTLTISVQSDGYIMDIMTQFQEMLPNFSFMSFESFK